MNDRTKEIVRKQIQTHNPIWITEIFNACKDKESTFLKICIIYDDIVSNSLNELNLIDYKKQVLANIQTDKELKQYDFSTLLEDSIHASWLSQNDMLPYCHESFWLHIKNQIQKTNIHDYDLLFQEKKLQYLFENWLYEIDIDLNQLNEINLLLNILHEIKEMIDFSNHEDLYDEINIIERESQEISKITIAC